MSASWGVFGFIFVLVIGLLAIIFLVVPLLKGLGWAIGGIFSGIGWLLRHIFEFIGGMLTDIVRFLGAIIAGVVLVPLVLLNVMIGRWSAAGHFFRSIKRECNVGFTCLYRVALQRPLRFLLLGGLLEGIEQRVDEAWEAAPTSDKPSRRTGSFEGYTITGSLPGGGSGAKLYIAEPDDSLRRRKPDFPKRVVIKSFAITDGSSLPQIVRESRALEAAKQLGLVLDHDMDEHRFFYVMPYHHGEHLGIITRQLHGKSDGGGLAPRQLAVMFAYMKDLLATLSRYHEGGLWHKDVKPDNIIVHDGRVHLVDLGLVTPLRSAMTLTTHGTEYFRDPEMVRMALKGVKVHQVDGAKFDIYAAGAVMYFLLENTFPAHGALSSFSKNSPEAARWIVRRSMTDYNKRYETVPQMLADLEYVGSAADPFAVKPAELPSMRGGGAEAAQVAAASPQPVEMPGETVAAAGSPRPPRESEPEETNVEVNVAGWGVSVGPKGVKIGNLAGEPAVEIKPQRPKIRVTNWWTGAYEVVDPATPGRGARADAKAFRQQVHGFRAQSADLRRSVHMGRMSARRAAREQIKAARARARDIQRRARAHRHRALHVKTADHQPSGMMAFMAVAVLVAGGFLVTWLVRQPRSTPHAFAGDEVFAAAVVPRAGKPLSLIVINDHPASTDANVAAQIEAVIKLHRDQGWEVIDDGKEAEVQIRKHLPAGVFDPDQPHELLRNAMRDHDLGGFLLIKTEPGEGPAHLRTKAFMIGVPVAEHGAFFKHEVPVFELDK